MFEYLMCQYELICFKFVGLVEMIFGDDFSDNISFS